MNARILEAARVIWDYHHLGHVPVTSDAILVLGSHDESVAERGAELYLQGLAPLLIFSGGLGRLTKGDWPEPEAERFARIAEGLGVPRTAMLIENRSTNTGENILFTGELLRAQGFDPHRFIVVQKPYMERRSYATFKKHWPDKELLVTSPQVSFDEYTARIGLEKVIQIMVGDLQRIRIYPAQGFQIPQEIPDEVWNAYEYLVEQGFDQYVIREM